MEVEELPTALLADWHSALPAESLAGSVYAVAAGERIGAARSLHRAGHGVHLDVIIENGDDPWGGVSAAEVRALREDLPDAVMDVHVMIRDGAVMTEELLEQVVRLAADVRAVALTVPGDLLPLEELLRVRLRAAETALWEQIVPGGTSLPSGHSDGVLLMLIAPGTTGRADANRLDLVERLARSGRAVGVDGGVTPRIAEAAHAAGACRIVSGRALFSCVPRTVCPPGMTGAPATSLSPPTIPMPAQEPEPISRRSRS